MVKQGFSFVVVKQGFSKAVIWQSRQEYAIVWQNILWQSRQVARIWQVYVKVSKAVWNLHYNRTGEGMSKYRQGSDLVFCAPT